MKPEIILNQIVIIAPSEKAPDLPLNAVCCVLVHAVDDTEYQALVTLKGECERNVAWLYREFEPENAEDKIALKMASSQLVVNDFLDRLSSSDIPALSRFSSILIGNRPDNLHIGNSNNV